MNPFRRISLDTGMSGTGYAIWDEMPWPGATAPLATGNIYPGEKTKGLQWMDRAISTCNGVKSLVDRVHPTHVYSEYPEFFAGDAIGYATAAKGDLQKLAFFCGMVCSYCIDRGIVWQNVFAREWKGQLPKHVVETRIKRLYTDASGNYAGPVITAHAWDAVGIGLYAKGVKL